MFELREMGINVPMILDERSPLEAAGKDLPNGQGAAGSQSSSSASETVPELTI
jgi:hypothetical protein